MGYADRPSSVLADAPERGESRGGRAAARVVERARLAPGLLHELPELRIERENMGVKIAEMMEDHQLDAGEKAFLDEEARRLHISVAGLQSMIQLAQRNRLMDKDLRSEFNLNVASQNGELAFEQFRSLVSQMKQIVFISDDKLGDIILAEGEVSTLEKSIYDQITAQKAGAISA
jgi:hypothetical protein